MTAYAGSQWNKWDLHVHTPASHVHGYRSATDVWEEFFVDLESLPQESKVIGINDYISIATHVEDVAREEMQRRAAKREG